MLPSSAAGPSSNASRCLHRWNHPTHAPTLPLSDPVDERYAHASASGDPGRGAIRAAVIGDSESMTKRTARVPEPISRSGQ
jgi:hypothetical protein